MATGPVIDLEPLLSPIAEDNRSGRSLVYDPVYDELKEARRQEEPVKEARRQDDESRPDDPWRLEPKVADWDRVIELGSECLIEQSKDLQIAAWITEALAHKYGFAGVRDGFQLLRELLERFWDSLYPEIEEDDLEYRASPFVFLNQDRTLPLLIREIPLTRGSKGQRYSCLRWQESRSVDNQVSKDPDALSALLDEGKITGEQYREAVAQTPRSFYEALNADLESALQAYQDLNKVLDARFAKQAPSLVGIRKAIDDVRLALVPILKTKREEEPDEVPEDVDEAPPEDIAEEETFDGDSSLDEVETTREVAPRRRARPPASGGPIVDAEDAIARIVEASAFLRENDPSNPVPFAVIRALRLAELYTLGQPPEPAGLVSPSSETRQELKRLAAEEDWEALLEQSERALGRPEGRAWLDAQRYALAAMANGSADRSAAIACCRALLRAVLADFPDLPQSLLTDDTMSASPATLSWITEEIVPPGVTEPEPSAYDPPPEPVAAEDSGAGQDGGQSEPDPWDLALDDVRDGRMAQGLNRLRDAMARAASGREKFRRKLQMAELCLSVGNHRVALPLLEELARRIDEFHLEQWEEESLSARVWGALYRALRDSGVEGQDGQAGRLHEVYTRLCRLDIQQALRYDGG